MKTSYTGIIGDKLTEAELSEYVSTFEETLQRFMGLSSEEIWELQRILLRRVRFKVSETLSPEGKTAMNQVKQDMLEVAKRKRVSSATLVSELFDLGSKQTEETPREEEASSVIVLVATDGSEMPADETNRAADDITDSAAVEKDEQSDEELNPKGTENTLTGTDGSVKAADEKVKQAKENIDQIADSESERNDARTDGVREGVETSDTGPEFEDLQIDPVHSVKTGVGSSNHEGIQPDNDINNKDEDTVDSSFGERQPSKGNDVVTPTEATSSSHVESESREGEGQGRMASQDRINHQSSEIAKTSSESETPNSLPT